ncbi:MAG: SpoIIE family protein phosphatase [Gemmatimonadota bacterium]
MSAEPRILVCTRRPPVAEALARELAAIGVEADFVDGADGWDGLTPSLVILDLAGDDPPVREARDRFGREAEIIALVDNESAGRLTAALAAGCGDYLFYPINPAELGLRWRRHVDAGEADRFPALEGLRGRLELTFPSSVRYAREVVEQVVRACERQAFSGPRARLNLRVALGEAVANAILYGNREDPDKHVCIAAEFEPGCACVTVADEGEGFDPAGVDDPTRPENRGRSHGRGLFLLKSLADEVRFNEAGNAVTLILGSGEAPDSERAAADRSAGRRERPPVPDGRLGDFLQAFGSATDLPFRLQIEGGGRVELVHDALGDAPADLREERWELPDGRSLVALFDARRGRAAAPMIDLLGSCARSLVAFTAETELRARELAERHEEIALLTSIGESVGSIVHLERAAEALLSRIVAVMGALHAGLWVMDEERGGIALLAFEGRAPEGPPVVPVNDPDSPIARVQRDREPLVLEPADEEARGDECLSALLAVPVRHTRTSGESRIVGVLTLRGRRGRGPFTTSDVKLMGAIASQVGAAIENGRLVRESLQRERMLAELQLAHQLQLKLLPELEDFSDLADVAARCEPAESVGGDFYHLIRLPEGRLGVMLGDVSSHGYSAGLIMALTMSAASIVAREQEEPAAVLRGIHHELVRKLESTDMYMTVCYAVVDPSAGQIRWANAGHPHAYLIGRDETQRLEALNPPLGIAEFDAYSQRVLEWRKGRQTLLMFTDGLSDCLRPDTLWSDERLTGVALQNPEASSRWVLDTLFELACPPTDLPADDRTALVVRL